MYISQALYIIISFLYSVELWFAGAGLLAPAPALSDRADRDSLDIIHDDDLGSHILCYIDNCSLGSS